MLGHSAVLSIFCRVFVQFHFKIDQGNRGLRLYNHGRTVRDQSILHQEMNFASNAILLLPPSYHAP